MTYGIETPTVAGWYAQHDDDSKKLVYKDDWKRHPDNRMTSSFKDVSFQTKFRTWCWWDGTRWWTEKDWDRYFAEKEE